MPKYPWPVPLVSYSRNALCDCYELTGCYDYILVKESPATLCVSTMRVVDAAEAKLRACPFMVLRDGDSTTAVSSEGILTPFNFDDHPVIQRRIHVDENWALVNSCALVATYVAFEFNTAEIILSSTMCIPISMAAVDIPYYANCRRGHVEKQLTDSRIVLHNARSVSVYSGKTFSLLRTFTVP